jgi:hypothetical protein
MVRAALAAALLLLAGGATATAATSRALVLAAPADAAVDEGISGWTRVVVRVRLEAVARGTVTIDYRTRRGTAGPDDFRAAKGSLRIPRGERLGTVEVDVRGDVRDEGNERFTVVFVRPRGARLVRSAATVLIRDDDDVPLGPVGSTTPGRPGPPTVPPLAAPALAGTAPASPGSSVAPSLFGSAPAGADVAIYLGAGCTGEPVARGVAVDLALKGIQVAVAANATTVFSAQALQGERRSACSPPVAYVHDGVPPAPPSLRRTAPASPSSSNEPAVFGTAGSDVVWIELHPAAACAGPPVTVPPSVLASGAQVTVPSGVTTSITAVAIDAAGNRSGCSAPLRYTETSAG